MGRRLRRVALVGLMVLAALAAPLAVPIRIVVLRRRRLDPTIALVVPRIAPADPLPRTV